MKPFTDLHLLDWFSRHGLFWYYHNYIWFTKIKPVWQGIYDTSRIDFLKLCTCLFITEEGRSWRMKLSQKVRSKIPVATSSLGYTVNGNILYLSLYSNESEHTKRQNTFRHRLYCYDLSNTISSKMSTKA